MLLDSGVERRPPPKPAGMLLKGAVAAVRTIVPALLLAGILLLIWSCRGEQATDFRFLRNFDPSLDPADGFWLSWAVLLLPSVFFIINLTSRRHGPSIALASAVLAWVFIGVGLYWALSEGLLHSLTEEIAPARLAMGFVGSLFLGELLCIYFFDWLRGVPWWKAPLFAAFIGGAAYVLAFHLATGGSWEAAALPRLGVVLAVQLIWASIQLVPTQLLRRAIRPAPGYGGA